VQNELETSPINGFPLAPMPHILNQVAGERKAQRAERTARLGGGEGVSNGSQRQLHVQLARASSVAIIPLPRRLYTTQAIL